MKTRLLHPDSGVQPGPVSAHSSQLPQSSTQPGSQPYRSNAVPGQSVLQSEAGARARGTSLYGREKEALSPSAGSHATDFSHFSLTALPSSRECKNFNYLHSCHSLARSLTHSPTHQAVFFPTLPLTSVAGSSQLGWLPQAKEVSAKLHLSSVLKLGRLKRHPQACLTLFGQRLRS